MDIITPIARSLAKRRFKGLERYATEPRQLQELQLRRIIKRLAGTQYGTAHGISSPTDAAAYSKQLPIVNYESLAPYIERMLRGEQNILTREKVKYFAKSSGTTNAKSKYLPLNDEHLQKCHYKGGMDSVYTYLYHHPESNFFAHKAFALAGSLDAVVPSSKVRTGDLSAVLLTKMPRLGRMIRVPNIHTALEPKWETKLDLMTDELIHKDIGNISGVPSWMMLVLNEVLRKSGAQSIQEVWPNLEVFFHGGVAFSPYRSEYEELLGEGVHYVETYNASEGFFGIQTDPNDPSLTLMLDYGVYYEFIPMEDFDEEHLTNAIPLHEVQLGKNYAMVISTLGGLYRYLIGDTVRFTSDKPYKFILSGRTKSFINAFGEELMVSNADVAFARVCDEMEALLGDYTAAPHFLEGASQGYHHWIIEWKEAPEDMERFAQRFDQVLKELNSDYEAKRYKDITLLPPRLTVVPQGTYYQWMKERKKLGGQNKVPRLAQDKKYIDELLEVAKKL
ncbi:MAG: GH3 auxin-responsive promoter family protein [Porphyromonas sp.]|nr:GH3 auxin-responsive promoter family protein [Porphyromonas sp.]